MFCMAIPRDAGGDPTCNLATAFSTARGRVGMKHETLAHLMGISAPQLSQQLAGEGHVSLRRLLGVAHDADGRAFLQALFSDLGTQIGLSDVDPLVATLGQLLTAVGAVVGQARLRMEKADLRGTSRERKSA